VYESDKQRVEISVGQVVTRRIAETDEDLQMAIQVTQVAQAVCRNGVELMVKNVL